MESNKSKRNKNKNLKQGMSVILAFSMVLSLLTGISMITGAETQKVFASMDASAPNWTSVSGFTNAATVPGGAELTGKTAYGNGISHNSLFDISAEVYFDIQFTEQTMTANDWFCITFGNEGYSLDPENTTGKGISFLMYKKSEGAIQSARDLNNRWLDFPFNQRNSFKLVKSADGWDLFLKNSVITAYELVGRVPFATVSATAFTADKAKLGFYVCGANADGNVKFAITDLIHKTVQSGKQNVMLTGADASFERTSTGDYTIADIPWGASASGTATYGTGVVSKTALDLSDEVSFKIKFTQSVPVGGWFAIALTNPDYELDPENTGGKGITFLMYQTGVNAIQSARDLSSRWLDFPAADHNIFTVKKGAEAWELYLQNAVIKDHKELIGRVPFTTLSENTFPQNLAKLRVYTCNGSAVTTAFDITYLTNSVTIPDEPVPEVQEVVLDAGASNWTASGDYTAVDVAGGANMTGTAGFKYGVTYNSKVDVSVKTEFDIKFTQQALTTGSSFIGITFGKDADSFNSNDKGATFLLYKTADAAVQSDKDTVSRWLDFPFAGVNTFKFGKGADGWELFLKNSIITDYALIGKIPFAVVSQDCFPSDEATLGIYVYDGVTPEQTIQFDITNLKHTTSISTETGPVLDAYDLATYTLPFWQGDTVYNESLMFVSNADNTIPAAPLLYVPSEIISIRSSDLKTEYNEGTDWVLENGKIGLPEGSRIPVIPHSQYYPETSSSSTFQTVDGKNILFTEGSFFHTKQIAVTYKHNTSWTGLIPGYSGSKLPQTISKLANKQPLKIVFYGDSITTGANSSGIVNAEPYATSWPVMVTESLKASYGYEDITVVNSAVGGKASQWGAENAQVSVADHHPDLVIIAFGMNDGNGSAVSPSAFKSNIESIMATVKASNPNVEFLLVSTSCPNPEVKMTQGNQAEYEKELLDLQGAGIATAPVTSVHQHILQLKRFYDMTGNNVNHPNDFLARIYAQVINAALINKGTSSHFIYPEKTFVLPTNDAYWNCANSSSVSNGTVTLNSSGIAAYTGSKLENRLAQFNFSAAITEENWIGFMTRQSNPGSAPWDQSQVYWVIIKKNGAVELIKRKNGTVSTLATGDAGKYVDANGNMALTTVRFGSIDETDGVRIVLDIGQDNIINFVDTLGSIDDSGLFGVITLNTATAKLYTGIPGSDRDENATYSGFGKGKGYLGGEINPAYIVPFSSFTDYLFTGTVQENTVLPDEIQSEINMDDLIAQIEQQGNHEVTVAINKPVIVDKSVFEALKGKDKALTFKVVDENGRVLYSWTFLGKDITGDTFDVNLGLHLQCEDQAAIEDLTDNKDLLCVTFDHQGNLPSGALIHLYLFDAYSVGDNLRLYYYKDTDHTVKLISKDLIVDHEGYVNFSITHASTYFLTKSSKDLSVNPVDTTNPVTGDNNVMAILLFVLSLLSGLALIRINRKNVRAQ